MVKFDSYSGGDENSRNMEYGKLRTFRRSTLRPSTGSVQSKESLFLDCMNPEDDSNRLIKILCIVPISTVSYPGRHECSSKTLP